MAIEVEMKYIIPASEVEELRERLHEFDSNGRKYEQNIMLDNLEKRMFAEDARLRLRLISDERFLVNKNIEFCYKKHVEIKDGIKTEEEIETEFYGDPEIFLQILNKMGYKPVSSYERFRETFRDDGIKITLDEFPFGYVIELEGEIGMIRKLSEQLDLKKENVYVLSCDDLYHELCKKEGKTPKQDINFDDPEMPKY